MKETLKFISENNLQNDIAVDATFCFENCGKSPNVKVGDTLIESCTAEKLIELLKKKVNNHE